MAEKLRSWSISRYNDYQTCPARFAFKHLLKTKTPPQPETTTEESPLERGSRIHKNAEDYVRGNVEELPPPLRLYAAEFAELRAISAAAEQDWAFDDNWEECDKFAMDVCRVRIKTDAHHLEYANGSLRIIDYKTGKVKDRGYEDQLELYAVGGFSKYGPAVKTIQVELWYLDHHVTTRGRFGQWQLQSLKDTWARRVKKLLADQRFDPKPGNFCRWCDYSVAKMAGMPKGCTF